MKTNDLKKGTAIILRNGWRAELLDNRKGNTRLAMVYGIVQEAGSVYAHDIARAFVDGNWQDVTLTPAQIKFRDSAW